MDKIQEKAYFNIGNSEYYEGYHIKDERWNMSNHVVMNINRFKGISLVDNFYFFIVFW